MQKSKILENYTLEFRNWGWRVYNYPKIPSLSPFPSCLGPAVTSRTDPALVRRK
jgi:hypothetical protein